SKFLRHQGEEQRGRLYRSSERIFNAGRDAYDATLQIVLRHKFLAFATSLAVIALTVVLFAAISKGFLPNEDVGFVFASTEGQQGISFEAMVRHQQQVAAVVSKNPYVKAFSSTVGGGMGGAGNTGRMMMTLIDRKYRPSAEEIVQQLRP